MPITTGSSSSEVLSRAGLSELDFYHLFKDEIDALTYTTVLKVDDGYDRILVFKNASNVIIKELVIQNFDTDYTAFLRDAVLLLITENSDNIVTEDNNNIQLA